MSGATGFMARMNKINGAQPANQTTPAVGQPAQAQQAHSVAPGGFSIPGTTPAAAPVCAPPPVQAPVAQGFSIPAEAAPAPAAAGFVVGAPHAQPAPIQTSPIPSVAQASVAPYQVNPPESASPPSQPPSEPPPAAAEAVPAEAGKGAKKGKGKGTPPPPTGPSVPSDDYLEHHARQCAALQGAFANPHLVQLSPEDFASFVSSRLSAFESLGGVK